MNRAPMPPRPALALAEPEARFLGSHSIEAIEVRGSETAGSPPPALALLKLGVGKRIVLSVDLLEYSWID